VSSIGVLRDGCLCILNWTESDEGIGRASRLRRASTSLFRSWLIIVRSDGPGQLYRTSVRTSRPACPAIASYHSGNPAGVQHPPMTRFDKATPIA
jgi:hypothetical protein